MIPLLLGNILQYFFGITLFVTAVFLILVVLVQRGRGGGLAGAFGGLGGQSAFGTKAGDLFTRITIGVATFWILLCLSALWLLRPASPFGEGRDAGGSQRPAASSTADPAGPGEGAAEDETP